jgi:hypothetical protein
MLNQCRTSVLKDLRCFLDRLLAWNINHRASRKRIPHLEKELRVKCGVPAESGKILQELPLPEPNQAR